jgi:uncharacterized protein
VSHTEAPPGLPDPLPLFPLRLVLFPGGRLPLKLFEARYLDLASRCLRQGQPFGVVALTEGAEAGTAGQVARFMSEGTLARIDTLDAPQPGILLVQCTGTQRFALAGPATQQADGLWQASARLLPDDPATAVPDELGNVADAFRRTAAELQRRGMGELLPDTWHDTDAGWLANRWAEWLAMPLAMKQALMLMNDPLQRLRQVQQWLVSASQL